MSKLNDNLKMAGFNYRHSLGQNFISDSNFLCSIVNDSGITSEDIVVEIGTGAGTLTEELAKVAKKVISYEIDSRLIPIIHERLAEYDNVEIINRDILQVQPREIAEVTGGKFKIVANLPYYITTPIIMHFMESELDIDTITIMVQKEVASRLIAPHNTKDYGAITVAVQAFSDVSVLKNVPRTVFHPMPNVDSAIVQINVRRNKLDIYDKKMFRSIVRSAFAMRRKTYQNNLVKSFNITREQAVDYLEKLGVSPQIRGEALSIEQFAELQNIMYQEKKL